MSTITATEARATLPDLLDRVAAGEEVIITRHGQPVAVVVRPDAIRARRADQALADAEHLRTVLDRGRSTSLRDISRITRTRAAELAAEVAAGRAAR